MTLKEIKLRTLSLIEEVNPDSQYLTDDIDIQAKINYAIDIKQKELARIKKIAAYDTMKVKENEQINLSKDIKNFFQLNSIKGIDYDIFEDIVIPKEDGTIEIQYYKYPKSITSDTKDNDYKFELSEDVLGIMPLGVAALLLKNDVAAQYGQMYSNEYQQALQMVDMKYNKGSIRFEGGFNG